MIANSPRPQRTSRVHSIVARRTTRPHSISVKDLPPVLVISTTGDPATPYQAGVDLANQLHGALLTFDGTQHTVALEGNSCVDDFVVRYLIDVTVPPPGARC